MSAARPRLQGSTAEIQATEPVARDVDRVYLVFVCARDAPDDVDLDFDRGKEHESAPLHHVRSCVGSCVVRRFTLLRRALDVPSPFPTIGCQECILSKHHGTRAILETQMACTTRVGSMLLDSPTSSPGLGRGRYPVTQI
jgi:hypothetical protein